MRNSAATGVRWTPRTHRRRRTAPPAPRAAPAPSGPGAVSSTATSTALVIAAASCCPRGSICWDMSLLRMPTTGGRPRSRWAQVATQEGRPSGGVATDQDIRHSAERTRQWSTARRLVSMVEDMTATVGVAEPCAVYEPSRIWTTRPRFGHGSDRQRPAPGLRAPGRAGAARRSGDLAAVGVEDQRGGGAQHAQRCGPPRGAARRRPRRGSRPAPARRPRRAPGGWPGTVRRTPRRTAAASPAPPAGTATPAPVSTVAAAGVRAAAGGPAGAAEAPVGGHAVDREADDDQHADEQHPLSGRHACPNDQQAPAFRVSGG